MRRLDRIGLATLLGALACSSPASPPRATPTQPACKCPPSGNSVVQLPANLPADPTFVESDTCQAFLARGGISLHTETKENCKIQVTLANGEVLTSTAAFEPLPDCCGGGFFLTFASPFQASNIGAPDAAARDGSADGAADARFAEWWYPECGTPANNCPETCAPVKVLAAPAACGPYEELMVGCVPRDLVVAGWFCLMRTSTGEIIFTEEGPSNGADFQMCPAPINGNLPGVPPTCPDASAP
jgi:hypothetical protein